MVLLLLPKCVVCLNPHTPEAYLHLWQAFQVGRESTLQDAKVTSAFGDPVRSLAALPRQTVITMHAQDLWGSTPAWDPSVIEACLFTTDCLGGLLKVRACAILARPAVLGWSACTT